ARDGGMRCSALEGDGVDGSAANSVVWFPEALRHDAPPILVLGNDCRLGAVYARVLAVGAYDKDDLRPGSESVGYRDIECRLSSPSEGAADRCVRRSREVGYGLHGTIVSRGSCPRWRTEDCDLR